MRSFWYWLFLGTLFFVFRDIFASFNENFTLLDLNGKQNRFRMYWIAWTLLEYSRILSSSASLLVPFSTCLPFSRRSYRYLQAFLELWRSSDIYFSTAKTKNIPITTKCKEIVSYDMHQYYRQRKLFCFIFLCL